MPIYEYVCESCRHQFEVRQKFSDDPISACVRCGQAVKKIISAPAIMFKGSGWYVTDYSDKLKSPDQSNATESAKPSTSPEAKSPAASSNNAAPSTTAATPPAPSGSGSDSGSKSSPAASPSPSSTSTS